MNAARRRPPEILLVEDSEFEVYMVRRAFEQVDPRAKLHHVGDGEACLRFLRRQPPYESAPEPDLVLMDLDMPVMSGSEALAAISRDEALMHLPVIILSARDDLREVVRLYRLRCSSYICKPMGLESYTELVRRLTEYWLGVVLLPRSNRDPSS